MVDRRPIRGGGAGKTPEGFVAQPSLDCARDKLHHTALRIRDDRGGAEVEICFSQQGISLETGWGGRRSNSRAKFQEMVGKESTHRVIV